MSTSLPDRPVEATLHADNLNWKLHMSRDFTQDQAAVWDAITKADLLAQWAPYRPAHDLLANGDVWLTPTRGEEEDVQGRILDVHAPTSLHFLWGSDQLRFELTPNDAGTGLTLTHTFTDRNAAPGLAASWHLCLGALEHLLAGKEVPSVVGSKAEDFGREDLEDQYRDYFNHKGDASEPTGSV